MRELRFSNGIVIVSDRGQGIYRAPNVDGIRYCRNSAILYFELDAMAVCQESNAATAVAGRARELLVDGVTSALLKVEALVKGSIGQKTEERSARKI